jgi:hypothetical protein
VLAFADSRQDAAFFAPYLERTYDRILVRALIYKTLPIDAIAKEGDFGLMTCRAPCCRGRASLPFCESQSYEERCHRLARGLCKS